MCIANRDLACEQQIIDNYISGRQEWLLVWKQLDAKSYGVIGVATTVCRGAHIAEGCVQIGIEHPVHAFFRPFGLCWRGAVHASDVLAVGCWAPVLYNLAARRIYIHGPTGTFKEVIEAARKAIIIPSEPCAPRCHRCEGDRPWMTVGVAREENIG